MAYNFKQQSNGLHNKYPPQLSNPYHTQRPQMLRDQRQSMMTRPPLSSSSERLVSGRPEVPRPLFSALGASGFGVKQQQNNKNSMNRQEKIVNESRLWENANTKAVRGQLIQIIDDDENQEIKTEKQKKQVNEIGNVNKQNLKNKQIEVQRLSSVNNFKNQGNNILLNEQQRKYINQSKHEKNNLLHHGHNQYNSYPYNLISINTTPNYDMQGRRITKDYFVDPKDPKYLYYSNLDSYGKHYLAEANRSNYPIYPADYSSSYNHYDLYSQSKPFKNISHSFSGYNMVNSQFANLNLSRSQDLSSPNHPNFYNAYSNPSQSINSSMNRSSSGNSFRQSGIPFNVSQNHLENQLNNRAKMMPQAQQIPSSKKLRSQSGSVQKSNQMQQQQKIYKSEKEKIVQQSNINTLNAYNNEAKRNIYEQNPNKVNLQRIKKLPLKEQQVIELLDSDDEEQKKGNAKQVPLYGGNKQDNQTNTKMKFNQQNIKSQKPPSNPLYSSNILQNCYSNHPYMTSKPQEYYKKIGGFNQKPQGNYQKGDSYIQYYNYPQILSNTNSQVSSNVNSQIPSNNYLQTSSNNYAQVAPSNYIHQASNSYAQMNSNNYTQMSSNRPYFSHTQTYSQNSSQSNAPTHTPHNSHGSHSPHSSIYNKQQSGKQYKESEGASSNQRYYSYYQKNNQKISYQKTKPIHKQKIFTDDKHQYLKQKLEDLQKMKQCRKQQQQNLTSFHNKPNQSLLMSVGQNFTGSKSLSQQQMASLNRTHENKAIVQASNSFLNLNQYKKIDSIGQTSTTRLNAAYQREKNAYPFPSKKQINDLIVKLTSDQPGKQMSILLSVEEMKNLQQLYKSNNQFSSFDRSNYSKALTQAYEKQKQRQKLQKISSLQASYASNSFSTKTPSEATRFSIGYMPRSKQISGMEHIKRQAQKAYLKTRSRQINGSVNSKGTMESSMQIQKRIETQTKNNQNSESEKYQALSTATTYSKGMIPLSKNQSLTALSQDKEGSPAFEWTPKLKRLRQLIKKRQNDSVILIGPQFQAQIPKYITNRNKIRKLINMKRISLLKRLYRCSY